MTVTATQLAAMLAPLAQVCSCTPKSVCPGHRAQYPAGPVACRAAGCVEPLDPTLWPDGLHMGCTEPVPVPEQLSIPAATSARAARPCDDPFCGPGGCGWQPAEHLTAATGGRGILTTAPAATVAAPAAPGFTAPAGPPPTHPLKAELVALVRWAAADQPRSRQVAVGPSEIGVACMRRLAYRYAGATPVNTTADPWFSIVGTAVHEWLAVAVDQYNAKVLGPPNGTREYAQRRYWVEERVTATADQHGISGSCDLYDADRRTVIDHKVVGPSALKTYRDKGPSEQYRTQVHVYGLGHEQAGRPVDEVAIAFYPRNGYLTDLHVWAEPYGRHRALAALRRAASVQQLAAVLPPAAIPAAPDAAACTWCPFYRPGPPADGAGCPGPLGDAR